MVAGIGRLGADQLRLWHAAREAARVAVVDPDPAAARAAAERTGLAGFDMRIDPAPAYRVQGDPLTVTLDLTAARSVPFAGRLLPLVLHARASMRIEQP